VCRRRCWGGEWTEWWDWGGNVLTYINSSEILLEVCTVFSKDNEIAQYMIVVMESCWHVPRGQYSI